MEGVVGLDYPWCITFVPLIVLGFPVRVKYSDQQSIMVLDILGRGRWLQTQDSVIVGPFCEQHLFEIKKCGQQQFLFRYIQVLCSCDQCAGALLPAYRFQKIFKTLGQCSGGFSQLRIVQWLLIIRQCYSIQVLYHGHKGEQRCIVITTRFTSPSGIKQRLPRTPTAMDGGSAVFLQVRIA